MEEKIEKENKSLSDLLKIKEVNEKLEECEKVKKEYLSGWQRSRADFLNYKKEEMERIDQILKYANEELILKILPILDNIYLAENKISDDLKNNSWVKGILQIKVQILDFLNSQKVEEIKTIEKVFDPNFHEIIEEAQINGKKSGIIIEEIQRGYTLHGRVIRPAKVKVAK